MHLHQPSATSDHKIKKAKANTAKLPYSEGQDVKKHIAPGFLALAERKAGKQEGCSEISNILHQSLTSERC